MPKYQVPRSQTIAATSSANTIAYPARPPTLRINSTGSSAMMPKATAAARCKHADQISQPRPYDRDMRFQTVRVDDCRDG